MANEENLIPNYKRTPSERRENARKAGIASGKARRKKANIKRTLESLLKMDLPSGEIKDQLESMGIDPSMEQGLVLSVILRTIQDGDAQALKTITTLMDQEGSTRDRKEQRAKIAKLEAETERIKAETELLRSTPEEEVETSLASFRKAMGYDVKDEEEDGET